MSSTYCLAAWQTIARLDKAYYRAIGWSAHADQRYDASVHQTYRVSGAPLRSRC